MKAHGVLGSLKYFAIVTALPALIPFSALADEPSSAPAPEKAASIPVLSAKFTNDTLTLSWPKSATNWMLSTQAVNGRVWSYVPAKDYSTNDTDIYLTTPLPDKTKFYRLVKTSQGFRSRFGTKAFVPPPPIPLPHPPTTHPKPPNSPQQN